jgi:hypothetical protein
MVPTLSRWATLWHSISRSSLSRQTSLPALPKEEVDPLAEQRMKWEKVKAPVHRLRTAVKIANARSPPSSGVQSTFFEYPIAATAGGDTANNDIKGKRSSSSSRVSHVVEELFKKFLEAIVRDIVERNGNPLHFKK